MVGFQGHFKPTGSMSTASGKTSSAWGIKKTAEDFAPTRIYPQKTYLISWPSNSEWVPLG